MENYKSFFIKISLVFITLFLALNCAAFGKSSITGNTSFWWTMYEQNENGVLQTGTYEKAADVASGFNLKQARLTFEHNNRPFDAKIQTRFEEKVAILDCYVSWQPSKCFQLYAGQMKIPTTYEALTADDKLDFISRSNISKNIADWSLSRPPYFSPFYGNRSDYRDIGVGVKGKVGSGSCPDLVSYFLMASNGLGANLSIGGKESKEYILSNDVGDYFYGMRLDVSPIKLLKFGGHYSKNKHDNILYNDGKTVLDLDRYSWSTDLSLILPFAKFTTMYAKGEVNDDYFHAALTNLRYSGWEAKLLFVMIKDKIQLGLRYDRYTESYFGEGTPTKQNDITFGCNFIPASNVRLQLNYVIKNTDSEAKVDSDDNILFLNFQYNFSITN